MKLDHTIHVELAKRLHESQRTRVQLEHFSRLYPQMEIEDSYAIQKAWMDLCLAEGRTVVGHKIGLTSRAMQIASQITEPDYGTLLDDMILRDGAEIDTSCFIVPRLEVEFAFVLARNLQGPGVTLFDVLNATDYVVPALELIDARIEQFDRNTRAPRKVLDTIADNAANGAIILGSRPMRPDAVDWRWAGALLFKNGVIEESGLGAAVLNHPGNGVAWLANRLAPYGQGLKAGEIVLGGSFTRPVASVIRVTDADEALAVANETEFGLSAGVVTTSLKQAARFKRHLQAGMVMVNAPTAGVDPHAPFGGRKASSFGAREQGCYAAEFFTTVKTAYVQP